MSFRAFTGLVSIALPLCAAPPGTVQDAVRRLADKCAKAPVPVAAQLRTIAAKDLQARYPELGRSLIPVTQGDVKSPPRARQEPEVSPAAAAIYQQFGRFGQVSTDADRAKLILDLSSQVRALPSGAARLDLARGLASAVTEGDMGPQTIASVADTLAESIATAPDIGPYMDLATLIHYEGVRPSIHDASLDAAVALLELRQSLAREARFSLTGLDGRVYSLAALRGKIVLVNFWATSCMPCRKEMPELQKIYRAFSERGFVVLAISTEERALVAKFIADKGYSFPILPDPDGEASAAFDVEGIPRTFLFDRQGRLVADAIDRRTESQFRSMLKIAGLE